LLRADGQWIGGFDLPFGQPRSLIEHEGWPTDWPEFVRFYCGEPRYRLREAFKRWCDARKITIDKLTLKCEGGRGYQDSLAVNERGN
jgi:hypothetical protein